MQQTYTALPLLQDAVAGMQFFELTNIDRNTLYDFNILVAFLYLYTIAVYKNSILSLFDLFKTIRHRHAYVGLGAQ